jgi:hypothetical protein
MEEADGLMCSYGFSPTVFFDGKGMHLRARIQGVM